MKQVLFGCVFFSFSLFGWSQNIQVDSQTYTPQQLVEEILIDSNCIENVVVTNVVGGKFGTSDQSYGYFEANGSGFPFENGIILSTGKIINAQGPNTTLSDDDASGWAGDADLEQILNEPNTLNATILEFEFTSVASQISFKYIFASEEYQENNANTCQYSDLFGFLIRPAGSSDYTNIALVPNTNTPVKVTTVHPEIPGGCEAINEFYFESFNGASAPINFNGQTKILTAVADVIPNQTYQVKLVIADEQNYRYDSAVFLEANSFQLSTDLGPDLLISTGSALCHDDTYQLDASQANAQSFKWFRNGVELTADTNPTLSVTQEGLYNVEVTLTNGCISYGQITIQYYPEVELMNASLTECDLNQDGFTVFDLFDAEQIILNGDNNLFITDFFLTEMDAIQNTNPIPNPNSFENTMSSQTVFARAETPAHCFGVAELQLEISTNVVIIPSYDLCDDEVIDGITEFDLNAITATFQDQIPAGANVSYFLTETDAFQNTNPLSNPFTNTQMDSQLFYVKVVSNNQCFAIATVELNVLFTPLLMADESVIYCENDFPETIELESGLLNGNPSDFAFEWFFNGVSTGITTSNIEVNEAGDYSVIATTGNGCSGIRTISVLPSNIATIDDMLITEASQNNTVSVQVSGPGIYEYSLDFENGMYQESNVFTNVFPGFHTVYVRDQNGCGVVSQLISVLGFPKYFTPNGDSYNDRWKVYGVNEQFNQRIDIKIFDRYGKLLSQQNHLTEGWDGTLRGNRLPSDDYWFVATLPDGRVYRGHFALKR